MDIFLEKFNSILIKCRSENCKFIIAGDFNIDVLSYSRDSREFLSLIEMFNVSLSFACVTRPLSGSCLDNMLSNVSGFCETMQYHISDHVALKLTVPDILVDKCQIQKFSIRKMNEEVVNDFLEALSTVSWDKIYDSSKDVNTKWSSFISIFQSIFNTYCPLKEVKYRSRSDICKLSPHIVEKKKILDNLLVISESRPEFKNLYRSFKRQYDSSITQAIKSYYSNFIANSQNKSRAAWRVIHSLSGKSTEKNLPFQSENPVDLCNSFNDMFVGDVANQTNIRIPGAISSLKSSHGMSKSFYFFDVTERDVSDVVKMLKTSNSSGHDGVPISIIKKSIHIIGGPLAHLINCAFREGCFPDELKIALVKPLFKKGNTCDLSSYRPISILSSFSKIFEKVFAVRLISFFRKFNVLADSQHGFTKDRGTETALFELLNSVLLALESDEVPLALMFDFQIRLGTRLD